MNTSSQSGSVLVLLPFLVQGALSLSILRAMRTRGLNVVIAYFLQEAPGYTKDQASDFVQTGHLIDLTELPTKALASRLGDEIEKHNVGLVLQIGAFQAYSSLPYLKDRHPHVRIVDMLYNEVGHTIDHFLYEACFDGVIVESKHMMRFVEHFSGKKKSCVQLVESGIDLNRFKARPPISPEGNLILGYIGRMSPEKNPIGFVELAAQLGPAHPSVSFVMYGEGNMTDEVRARVSATGLGEQLRFEGYAPDVETALASVDVLVVPSRIDGRPNAIMEANAVGRPVLASRVGGIPEMIIDGRNGYLISLSNMNELSGIVDRWTRNFSQLTASSRSARLAAEEHFDREKMLDRYEQCFRRFLATELSSPA